MGRFRNNDVDSETLCKQASEDNCIGFQPQDHRAEDNRAEDNRAEDHRAEDNRAEDNRAEDHRAKDEASEYDYFVHEHALLRIKGV